MGWVAFIKNLFATYRLFKNKSGAIYSLSPSLKYSDVLSELMQKKSYTVYIPEKYISFFITIY